MQTQHTTHVQHATPHNINLRVTLASLWAGLVGFYIYVDYLHFYMPGKMAQIQTGRVYEFAITPGFLIIALASIGIPALMIPFSVMMAPKVNRWTNIILATVLIPYSLFNLAGEAWIHMVIGAAVEVVMLGLIIRYAWKWSQVEA